MAPWLSRLRLLSTNRLHQQLSAPNRHRSQSSKRSTSERGAAHSGWRIACLQSARSMSMMGSVLRGSSTAWRTNKPFFVTLVVYVLVALAAAIHWNIRVDFELYSRPFLLFGCGVTVILFALISIRIMLERPPQLFPALRDRLVAYELPYRMIIGLPVVLVLPVFFSLFTSLKRGISRIVPFYADSKIMAIDRTIHGGVDAWLVLHPLLGYGPIIFVMNFFYSLWSVIMFIVLFCVTFSTGNQRLRSQYLVSYVLIWALLGTLAATIFASVGPAFVMPYYGDATFSPLMDHLRTIDAVYPVWSIPVQEVLFANMALDGPQMGGGISAFPSLHVAIATLNAIYLWRFGGLLRWAGAAFLVIIQLGAVYLAWHYGIDGYASMLAAPIIWVVAGRMAKPSPLSTATRPAI
ncbi:phosphatase PAP2 family protein [Mesorhizobium kowhaii]|uniref:phosphatase PAP2 family protein n=1 Tax=Mesorhizobium kowhaii TaxID=1300272 RepID=UPI0035E9CB57